jgi:FtsZ-interacting cell division protein ZipA
MTPLNAALLIIAILAVIVAVVVSLKMRTKKLRSKFGPEYDRVVQERGSAFKAERELEEREKRVGKFPIHRLSDQESSQFASEWRATQEMFVDDPRGAVAEADRLVQRTMKARGYPTGGEFDNRVADLSVEHPRVVEHYRAAHDIAVQDGRNAASTEDLRLAMKHYRELFEDLLGRNVEETTGARR